jgi:hypothetical protein
MYHWYHAVSWCVLYSSFACLPLLRIVTVSPTRIITHVVSLLSQMRTILAFLREYFNSKHGVNKKSVVILNPREPSLAMQELLSSQFFLEKVHPHRV